MAKTILGFRGKTLEELKKKFNCPKCGCDFIAPHNEYIEEEPGKVYSTYCPWCDHKVYKRVMENDNDIS